MDNADEFSEDSDDSVKDRDYIPNEVEYESSDDEAVAVVNNNNGQSTSNSILHEISYAPELYTKNEIGAECPVISNKPSTSTSGIEEPFPVPGLLAEGRTVAEAGIENVNIKKRTRKRQRQPEEWASNKRKALFDQGLEYISVRKKVVPAKKIVTKKDCNKDCRFKCGQNISDEERQEIIKEYYKLSAAEKKMYLLSTTEKFIPNRRRPGKQLENSKRKATYNYFFTVKGIKTQVCKIYFCSTLCISQKPVYTVHENKNVTVNTPGKSRQGKHRKRFIPDEDVQLVKDHINLFPRVASHYCRSNSTREYLDRFLSIRRMYELYKDWLQNKNKQPVKEAAYRHIFCTNFNLHFHVPKKDRCDTCEEIRLLEEENRCSDDKKDMYENHIKQKEAMRKERQQDRKGNTPVLCFDLENVLTCPKAEIGCFFYKSKFSVYNMTAHFSATKTVYCAVWPESLTGRSGNDIASAVCKILDSVAEDNPNVRDLILWSDSCVPQNRNSIISHAIKQFMKRHNHIENITMKFSTPGHSCVQEIDSVHSTIDRVLSKAEYFSPVSLLRLLLQVNRSKPYRIIQMRANDFKNYQDCAALLNYTMVPFSKVVQLSFSKSQFEVKYKTSHVETDYVTVNIKHSMNKRNSGALIHLAEPKIAKKANALPQNKIDALRSMFRWMPTVDKQYYLTMLPQDSSTATKKPMKKSHQVKKSPQDSFKETNKSRKTV